MTPLDSLVADVSPYVAGAFGLLGSIIGGAITATASFLVGRQASQVAVTSWIRELRRETYGRILSHGQELLIAHEASHGSPRSQEAAKAIDQAHSNLFEVYPVLQLIATRPVVDAARVYAYRLLELKEGRLGSENFWRVTELVRFARHDVIDAMRKEHGLADSAAPAMDFNPFLGTDFEDQYRRS